MKTGCKTYSLAASFHVYVSQQCICLYLYSWPVYLFVSDQFIYLYISYLVFYTVSQPVYFLCLAASYESPWTLPEPFAMKVYWVLMFPIKVLMFFSIPDCRRPGIWSKLYPATFILSIVWIAGVSYVMVWMITVAGK